MSQSPPCKKKKRRRKDKTPIARAGLQLNCLNRHTHNMRKEEEEEGEEEEEEDDTQEPCYQVVNTGN